MDEQEMMDTTDSSPQVLPILQPPGICNHPSLCLIESQVVDKAEPSKYKLYGNNATAVENDSWEIDSQSKIIKIACGDSHILILTSTGAVYSLGSSYYGQLGHADRTTYETCKRIEFFDVFANENIVTDIACGSWHCLALTRGGDVYTWGWNASGQLGLELPMAVDIFVTRPKMVKSLASKMVVQTKAGHSHSIVLINTGEIYAFGSNSNGQLGLGIAKGPNQNKPCLIEMFTGFPTALIEAGGFHSFALSKSGSVFGFGKNNYGQLGVGEAIGDKYQPSQLATLRSLGVCYIAAGEEHSAFLTKDGGVFTCGNGELGQLGHNSSSNEILPRKILEFGAEAFQVACGKFHTLCLTKDRLYSFGQLGRGVFGNHKNSPMHINALNGPLESIFAGGDKSIVLLPSPLSGDISASLKQVINLTDNEVPKHSLDYRDRSKSSQILTIDNATINVLCSATEPIDQDIITLTELIFSSPSIWNSSFIIKEKYSMPTTYKYIGVDLEEANGVLSKLEHMKAPVLKELLEQMVIKDLLPKLPHQLKHSEILRIYILIPLLPSFYNGLSFLLPILFAERIQSLDRQQSHLIFVWLYNAPECQVQRLVSVYKRTVITIIESSQSQSNKDRSLKICLKFLSELHSLNRGGGRLSHHTFAIPSLPNKVDIRQDYMDWCRYQGKAKNLFFFCDFPFIFDAQAKTLLLQTDQIIQMNVAMNIAASQVIPTLLTFGPEVAQHIQYLNLHVRRTMLVPDTLAHLQSLTTADLKKPLRVKFVGEEAEDAGGVKKEFFLLLIREILNPQYGMFKNYEDSRLIWFNANFFEDKVMYFLIGIICGLAIYNFIIINLPFPLALYKKLLNEKVDLQDLKELNPLVGRSLEQLMEYTGDDLEDVFSLTFEISEEVFGTMKTTELKPKGGKISVTQENKAEFMELYISHSFNTSVHTPFHAFKDGFERVCGGTVLPLFYAQELQAMVTGNEDYDWGELESNASYKAPYHADDLTIKLFWEVFHELTLAEKKQFLLFLTGSDRVPILGMKALKICIQPTQDEKYLPSAHTCFNLLDLPRYQTKERLRYKLLQAIQHNEGFSLV